MPYLKIHIGDLVSPIQSLERYFRDGGISIIQAAFAHSYFAHPDQVRAKTPYYPDSARRSKEHHPGLDKGKITTWPGDGRQIRLDYNQKAQLAWEQYTGRKRSRASGYGVRHSGATLGIPTRSRAAGICAICRSGRVCLQRTSIPTRI